MTYYGGEEAYQRQLAIQGISEEAYDHIRETSYLYQRLQDAFCTEAALCIPTARRWRSTLRTTTISPAAWRSYPPVTAQRTRPTAI